MLINLYNLFFVLPFYPTSSCLWSPLPKTDHLINTKLSDLVAFHVIFLAQSMYWGFSSHLVHPPSPPVGGG